MSTLALQYRPRRFEDLVGQRHIKPILQKMVETKSLPPALLLAGSRGTGKTTSGRILAAALNCADFDGEPCQNCVSCKSIYANSSMDVLEIDAASNGLVADIRKIKDAVMYQTGGFRVVLLDEAHSMSKEAFNALLKVLEEPPPETLFILLTTEPGKIPDTVLSRSMLFEFRRIPVVEIVQNLERIVKEEDLDTSPEVLLEIARRVQGGMRDAIMILDQISRIGVVTVEDFNDLFGISDVAIRLLDCAFIGDLNSGFSLIKDHFYRVGDASDMVNDMVAVVRDIMIVSAGGDLIGASDERIRQIQSMSRKVRKEKLVSVMKILWELKTRVRHIDNDQRAAMELSFVLITNAAGDSLKAVAENISNGKAELSLSELKELSSGRRQARQSTS